MPFWSDTLFAAEHTDVLGLLAWAGLSLGAGLVVTLASRRRGEMGLLGAFATVMVVGGIVELAVGVVWLRRLSLRDYESVVRLGHGLSAGLGVEVVLLGVGAWLVVTGGRLRPRGTARMGAGTAVALHGAALLGLTTLLLLAIRW